jgi:heme/copper-type cytochrome/quinol oxidase subunit 2
MKHNTKIVLLSAAGVLLSAGNVLAASNQSSTDVVGNLGMFSTLAGTIMTYSKYVAFFMAIISLLALWVTGMLAKISHKVNESINAKEGVKNWMIEAVLVIVAFIILFSWIIPTINGYVPSTA